jgi:beta-lactam-binding protein with PASTA domain
MPKKGSNRPKGGVVVLYTESDLEKETAKVPDLIGLTARQANDRIKNSGLNINIIGAESLDSGALAKSQKPAAGEVVSIGTIIEAEFRHNALTD